MFHADVMMNAPKDRTLFNYSPKHGWPMLRYVLKMILGPRISDNQNVQTILREFLGLPSTGEEEAFPHENKTTNTGTIRKSDSHELWPIIYGP